VSSDGPSAEGRFVVQRELGLHARPAGQFVSIAGRYACEIEVRREGDAEWVSGTSVLSILSLAATEGTVLDLRAIGDGAEEAVAELGLLIEAKAD
jgi:phosphocarrier protein